MVKQGTLLSELQSIVGKEHAREPEDGHEYDVDGLTPKAIVEPGTYDEVAEVLRFASTGGLAVIPRGAGLEMGLGNVPSRYDIAVSLKRLDQVIEHEPADLTVTCQAGMPIGRLRKQLSNSRQMTPGSRLEFDHRTIGGILASATGRGASSPRDFTIGMRFVTGDGVIARTGGRVVKNVAGYDLCKLLIGSQGTLGVIVEGTFKVSPLPGAETTLGFDFPSLEQVVRFSNRVRRSGLAGCSLYARRVRDFVVGVEPAADGWLVGVRASGSAAALETTSRRLQSMASEEGARVFDDRDYRASVAQADVPHRPPSTVRCSARVRPSKVGELAQVLESEGATKLTIVPLQGEAQAAFQDLQAEPAFLEHVRSCVARLEGRLWVTSCRPELKRRIDVFGPPPPSFALMRAIKREFDPNNVLSPGRFVGRL